MGNAVSNVMKEVQKPQNDAEKQVLADLNNLSEILKAKQEEYFTKLVNNKGEDKTIPIKTILEYKKHVSAQVSTEPSQHLTDAMTEMFGGQFLSSFKALALGSINAVLGNASAGSNQDTGYKVMVLHNTVVRIDYFVYGFRMHSSGVIDRKQNGLVFVATVGVVDMKNVGLESLVYLVGAQANEARAFMTQRVDEWQARRTALKGIDSKVTATSPTAADLQGWKKSLGEYGVPTVQQWLDAATDDSGLKAGSSPAEIAMAEAVKNYYNQFMVANATSDVVLEYKAWKSVVDLLYPKVQAVIDSQTKILDALSTEQNEALDRMAAIFRKARSVTKEITGIA